MNRKRKILYHNGRKSIDKPLIPYTNGRCRICFEVTGRTCPLCKMAFFCSPQHQNRDEEHKNICMQPLFVSMEIKDSKGSEPRSILVAKKDLAAGQVVFKEYPFVCGPRDYFEAANKVPTCLGCCQRMKRKKGDSGSRYSMCSKCGWPVCSKKCERSFQHASYECGYFSERKIRYPSKISIFRLSYFLYKSVYVLRGFLHRKNHPDAFREFMKLPAQMNPDTTKYAATHDKLVLKVLMETFQISSLFGKENELSEEELNCIINHMCVYGYSTHVLDVDKRSRGSVEALYWITSKVTRSCVPNLVWSIGPAPDFMLQATAARNIRINEELSLPYTSNLYRDTTAKRQEYIWNYYGKNCRCSRCKDPSERGTFLSSIKCSSCSIGYLLAQNLKSAYVCSNESCEGRCTRKEIDAKVRNIDLSATASIESSKITGIEEIEQRIQSLRKDDFLHPNHSIVFNLVWEVVKRQFEELHNLDWSALVSFLDQCEYLLHIEEKLCPTLSSGRATLYFYMGRAFFLQFEIFKTTGPTKKERQEILDKIMDLYDEARKYFVKCGNDRAAIKTIHVDMMTIVSQINELKKSH